MNPKSRDYPYPWHNRNTEWSIDHDFLSGESLLPEEIKDCESAEKLSRLRRKKSGEKETQWVPRGL